MRTLARDTPSTPPAIPVTAGSKAARATIFPTDAPRRRSRACSRRRSDRLEEAMPLIQRKEKHVIRRCLGTAAGRRAHCLEETVGEWQVDNRVDRYLGVWQPGASYHHDGAGLRLKVGSRLLGEQCVPFAQELPDFAGEHVPVSGLKA